ncbi:MAG: bifunctional proline dehydrogenase/L-glutamate gamma-semialdehyde dehydrogenase PutA, partial [Pseudomonadota bacterium]
LHPRYEVLHRDRVLKELVPVVTKLARQAREAGIAFHIDAEEQDRLVLSLQVIDSVLADPALGGWDGFGVVVQAYGKRAGAVIDRLYDMATRYHRRINIRLVKGAYWDSEMKLAQVAGLPDFTLFTSKAATDVSYICLAKKLFDLGDRLFPQFATHNAHSVAAVLNLAQGRPFEFQRLHGIGERLHDIVKAETRAPCRIYAPVGAHRDLLAYLVRRLLENGANSSFVHQIVDETVPPEEIAKDPFAVLTEARAPTGLVKPDALFQPHRRNARGWDLFDEATLQEIEVSRLTFPNAAFPITVSPPTGSERPVLNPATGAIVGTVIEADAATTERALDDARLWSASRTERAAVLRRAADLYEAQSGALFGLLGLEAGKTVSDCVGELREAVDFLRYYASEGEGRTDTPRGVITAISPWNFPLAIFTGQIAAALMAGNAVLAKPAEQTPLIAAEAVRLLHEAGVPKAALQLLPGSGAEVGAALTRDPRVKGVVFTGSTATAQRIAATMATHLDPGTPLIAETGGLNAMIVDSTALPEQAVRDIIASAFQSAGQRCSALRCLYLQEDSADHILEMIRGAMDALVVGDPQDRATDVGPIIDAPAGDKIIAYLSDNESNILHQITAPETGNFVSPTLLRVNGIEDLTEEVFGPVLHVATFAGDAVNDVVEAINATGYGLTFGLHTRIDTRVQEVSDAIHAGNVYVNRNQIGAVVGSQPFGGEGLSGTGPKAGGPFYLPRFYAPHAVSASTREGLLPGPTGELNRWTTAPRGPVLCLGPTEADRGRQMAVVEALGGQAETLDTRATPDALTQDPTLTAVLWWGDDETARAYARALADRDGPLVPLITDLPDAAHVLHERHLCVDTTASGGNAALLAG